MRQMTVSSVATGPLHSTHTLTQLEYMHSFTVYYPKLKKVVVLVFGLVVVVLATVIGAGLLGEVAHRGRMFIGSQVTQSSRSTTDW